MKAERLGIAIIFIFLIVFTPLVSWITDSFNLGEPWNMIAMRSLTGVLLYLLGVYALSGLKSDLKTKPKVAVGKRQINYVGILCGIGLIGVMWFTDLSSIIVNTFYTNQATIKFLQWDLNISYIFIRLVISISTFIGIFIIKKSTARKMETMINERDDDYLANIVGGIQ